MDLAKLIGGSGIIEYRGLSLESKDGITITPMLETNPIPIDGISEEADMRTSANKVTISVTPSGKWTNPDRLFPYWSMPAGRYVLPVLDATVNIGTNDLSATNHDLYDGDAVMIGIRPGGTLPTSTPQVDEDTTYYANVTDADTITLHPTRADADAGSNTITFEAAGSDVVIVGQFDLVVRAEDGMVWTFHAVAITGQPDLNLTRTDTPFGTVEFTAYVRNRKRIEDDNSIYTLSTEAFTGWTANAADILTQSPRVAWADLLTFAPADVDADNNELDITGHGLSTEDKVYFGTTGLLPGAATALDPEQAYYVRAVDVDTLSVHPTAADATADTNAIDLTSGGSGNHLLLLDNPPYTLLDTEAGVTVSSSANLTDRVVDRDGIVNARLSSANAEARFIALSLAVSNILNSLKLQGAGAELGRSLSATSKPLHIWSAGMYVKLNGAALNEGEVALNMTDDRIRELMFKATRVVVGGSVADLGRIGTSAA